MFGIAFASQGINFYLDFFLKKISFINNLGGCNVNEDYLTITFQMIYYGCLASKSQNDKMIAMQSKLPNVIMQCHNCNDYVLLTFEWISWHSF